MQKHAMSFFPQAKTKNTKRQCIQWQFKTWFSATPKKQHRVGEFSAWSSDANPSPVQAELSEMRQELAVKASIIQ